MRLPNLEQTHDVTLDGAVFTVKPFSQAQQANYAQYMATAFLSGQVNSLEEAIEQATSNTAWRNPRDVERFVKMIGDNIVSISGLEGAEDMTPAQIVNVLPYAYITYLGRKIEALSTLTDDEIQDSSCSSGSQKSSSPTPDRASMTAGPAEVQGESAI